MSTLIISDELKKVLARGWRPGTFPQSLVDQMIRTIHLFLALDSRQKVKLACEFPALADVCHAVAVSHDKAIDKMVIDEANPELRKKLRRLLDEARRKSEESPAPFNASPTRESRPDPTFEEQVARVKASTTPSEELFPRLAFLLRVWPERVSADPELGRLLLEEANRRISKQRNRTSGAYLAELAGTFQSLGIRG